MVAHGAGAGEDVVGERAEDAPLRRAGVLRFVEQDVADAAVELPQHPFGGVRAREQVGGGLDQVVEVETGAGALAVCEVGEHHVGEAEDGGGAFEQARGVERAARSPGCAGSRWPSGMSLIWKNSAAAGAAFSASVV